MSITNRARSGGATVEALPGNIFRYVMAASGMHQLLLLALSNSVFLLEVLPLELQRRIVNDLVKDRPYRWSIALCLVYAAAVLVQGGTVPQFLFVPLTQAAVNRRAGSRIRTLRQLGIGIIDRANGHFRDDDRWIDRVFALDMGIFRLKFTMNFLMNLCSHLQIISALLIGGWWVYTDRLQIGGVVAFISGIDRLNDLWGDLVNYFRDISVNQVKYRLLANAVNQLAEAAEA